MILPNLQQEEEEASAFSNFTQLSLKIGWLPSAVLQLLSHLGTSYPNLNNPKVKRADLFPHQKFGPNKPLHRIQF
jgi:hypothetical protein